MICDRCGNWISQENYLNRTNGFPSNYGLICVHCLNKLSKKHNVTKDFAYNPPKYLIF